MTYQTITIERKEQIAVITLNRPERLNAISPQMRPELIAAFDEVDADDGVRAVIITGAGRGFCAGADVGEMVGGDMIGGDKTRSGAGATIRDTEEYHALMGRDARVIQRLYNVQKPTIAMINGVAVGAGFGISLACDIRVGSEKTRFMNAFVRVAVTPGWGLMWLLPRIVGLGKALEILYTADFLEAPEAEKLGILNRLVPASDLESATMSLAKKIANGPPLVMALTKQQVYRGLTLDFATALQNTLSCEAVTIASEDHEEGVNAFREKRPAVFKGK